MLSIYGQLDDFRSNYLLHQDIFHQKMGIMSSAILRSTEKILSTKVFYSMPNKTDYSILDIILLQNM